MPGGWFVAVNGHAEPMRSSEHGAGGALVPPYEAYVSYNGWPAATFGVNGGIFVAGSGANAESFSAALRALIEEARCRNHD